MSIRTVLAAGSAAALLAVLLVTGAPPASAGGTVTYEVTTNVDVVDGGDGVISLREAFTLANDDPLNGLTTIDLEAAGPYNLTICAGAQEDSNASGDLDHTDNENLTLNGERVINQTCPNERVIDARGASSLFQLSRATVTGGHATANGGGIRAAFDLQIVLFATVAGNSADGNGGGAWAGDDISVAQSTIRENSSGGTGGGVRATASVAVQRSTFHGNVAALVGGAIDGADGVTVRQSTVTQNRSSVGGGVSSNGDVTVNTSTVVANRAFTGANLQTAADLTVTASIVALGSQGPDCDFDTATPVGGYNLGDDSSCGNNIPGDNDADHPMLAALANAGGVTQVRRPVTPSPAINNDATPCAPEAEPTDQHFHTRPVGPGCDAGAFEGAPQACAQAFPDVPTSSQFFDEICWLDQMDITGGFADGEFKPSQSVTRQSMAAFLFRLAGSPPFPDPPTASFPDVPTNSQFFTEIEWLADEEITGGFADGTFKPGQSVTRQAMAAFLFRVMGDPESFHDPATATFPDVPVGSTFFTEIEWLADAEITGGFADGTFKPAQAVSRQAMAAFLLRMAEGVNMMGF
jgi:hypothetical protein